MDKKLRVALLGGFATVATLLAMSSVAWACGGVGAAQSAVPGAVAVRSATGSQGTPVGSNAPSFSSVVIPSAAPVAGRGSSTSAAVGTQVGKGVAIPAPARRADTSSPAPSGVAAATVSAPSPRSAAGDLWNGFTTGPASQAGSLRNLGGASGSSSAPMTALALLGGGGAALFAGFAAAELRRRRVPVAHTAA